MLTGRELAQAQADFVATLTGVCNILRPISATSSKGGRAEASAPVVAANVPCRVAPGGNMPQERRVAERLQSAVILRVSLPAGTDVQPSDRIETNGRTLEVVAELTPDTLELVRRVLATEHTP